MIQTAAAAFMLASATGATAAQQVVLQPNESTSKDAKTYNFLSGNNFQSNLGIIGTDNDPHFFYSLLQFTEVNSMWVPPSLLSNAKLDLWVTALDTNVVNQVNLHDVTGDWTETGVTMSTFPTYNSTASASATVTANGAISLDVTASLIAWLTSPATNKGWALIPGTAANLSIADADGITGDPTKAPKLTLDLNDFTDTKAPVIKITAPTAGTVAGAFTLTGTVNEDVALKSFTVTLNGAPVTLDAQATFVPKTNMPWSASNVAPENGSNTIVVTAVDFANHTTTATKIVGYVNNRPELAGTYNAVLLPNVALPADNDTTGLVTVTVAKSGSFSGRVTLGGVAIPIAGVLKNNGAARFKPTLATTCDLIDRTEFDSHFGMLSLTVVSPAGLSGTLSTAAIDGFPLATFSGKVASYTAAAPVDDALLNLPVGSTLNRGQYNIAFPSKAQTPSMGAADYPQGDGYTSLTLARNGNISFSGYLADGSRYIGATRLRADGTAPLYVQLYRKQGAMAGSVTFSNLANTDVAGTNFLWLRPAQPRARLYPLGWPNGVKVDAAGTKFAGPASLDFGQGAADLANGNASLVFTDGGLPGTITKVVSVNPGPVAAGQVKVVPATNLTYKLSLSASTGVFSGTVVMPSGTETYRGILLNKVGNKGGFGYFLTTPALSYGATCQGGGVSLDPGVDSGS
jgi:hypothetical protein